jgi:DNA invertase Pin-like site-specific DNA recombinase
MIQSIACTPPKSIRRDPRLVACFRPFLEYLLDNNGVFERDLIRERTGAGREAAKQRGVRFGRPRKLNTDQTQVALQFAR